MTINMQQLNIRNEEFCRQSIYHEEELYRINILFQREMLQRVCIEIEEQRNIKPYLLARYGA